MPEIIADIEDHMPFQNKLSKYKHIGRRLVEARVTDDFEDCQYCRKEILQEFEVFGLLKPRRFGRYAFRDIEAWKRLYEFIHDYEEMIDEQFAGMTAYLDFVDDPDESVAVLYENTFQNMKVRQQLIKKFYRTSKPYKLLKYLFDHEHEVKEFRVSKLTKILGVHKHKRKFSDWINDLKIDTGMRRGRYIEYDGELLCFTSHRISGLQREYIKQHNQ